MNPPAAGSVGGAKLNGGGSSNRASDMPFPWKLHEILEYVEGSGGGRGVNGELENLQAIVSWLPSGKAFKVHQPAEFEQRILPLYFRSTRLKSFQRNLSVYRFQRVDIDSIRGAYRHEFFVRGNRDLCRQILRQPSTSGRYSDGATMTDGPVMDNVAYSVSGVPDAGAHHSSTETTAWETEQEMQHPPHGSRTTAWFLTNTMPPSEAEQESPTYFQPGATDESTMRDQGSNFLKRNIQCTIKDYGHGTTSSSRWVIPTTASLPTHPPSPTPNSTNSPTRQRHFATVARANSNNINSSDINILKPAAKSNYLNSAALAVRNAQFDTLQAMQQQLQQQQQQHPGIDAEAAPSPPCWKINAPTTTTAAARWVGAVPPHHPISRYNKEMNWVFFGGTTTPSMSSSSSTSSNDNKKKAWSSSNIITK
jgi:HSF-type DNA-binding